MVLIRASMRNGLISLSHPGSIQHLQTHRASFHHTVHQSWVATWALLQPQNLSRDSSPTVVRKERCTTYACKLQTTFPSSPTTDQPETIAVGKPKCMQGAVYTAASGARSTYHLTFPFLVCVWAAPNALLGRYAIIRVDSFSPFCCVLECGLFSVGRGSGGVAT